MGAFWEGPWPDEAQQDPRKLVVPPPLSPVLKELRERLYLTSPLAAQIRGLGFQPKGASFPLSLFPPVVHP